jgi:hypothetical protein
VRKKVVVCGSVQSRAGPADVVGTWGCVCMGGVTISWYLRKELVGVT